VPVDVVGVDNGDDVDALKMDNENVGDDADWLAVDGGRSHPDIKRPDKDTGQKDTYRYVVQCRRGTKRPLQSRSSFVPAFCAAHLCHLPCHLSHN
jgi:hypothetical protein